MKISLDRDGGVSFDGVLFASLDAAVPALRSRASQRPQPGADFEFEAPHNFDRTGALIYTVQRIWFECGDAAAAAPRATGGTAPGNKRLTFWGANEDDDSLVRDVIAGRKTVTADTVDAYYQPYGEFGDGSYQAGDLIDVYDLKQRLRCRIRATKVYNIKFGDIPEEVWRGETFNSAEQFRQVHIDALPHLQLHDDCEFVTLHFDLVEVIDAAHPGAGR